MLSYQKPLSLGHDFNKSLPKGYQTTTDTLLAIPDDKTTAAEAKQKAIKKAEKIFRKTSPQKLGDIQSLDQLFLTTAYAFDVNNSDHRQKIYAFLEHYKPSKLLEFLYQYREEKVTEAQDATADIEDAKRFDDLVIIARNKLAQLFANPNYTVELINNAPSIIANLDKKLLFQLAKEHEAIAAALVKNDAVRKKLLDCKPIHSSEDDALFILYRDHFPHNFTVADYCLNPYSGSLEAPEKLDQQNAIHELRKRYLALEAQLAELEFARRDISQRRSAVEIRQIADKEITKVIQTMVGDNADAIAADKKLIESNARISLNPEAKDAAQVTQQFAALVDNYHRSGASEEDLETLSRYAHIIIPMSALEMETNKRYQGVISNAENRRKALHGKTQVPQYETEELTYLNGLLQDGEVNLAKLDRQRTLTEARFQAVKAQRDECLTDLGVIADAVTLLNSQNQTQQINGLDKFLLSEFKDQQQLWKSVEYLIHKNGTYATLLNRSHIAAMFVAAGNNAANQASVFNYLLAHAEQQLIDSKLLQDVSFYEAEQPLHSASGAPTQEDHKSKLELNAVALLHSTQLASHQLLRAELNKKSFYFKQHPNVFTAIYGQANGQLASAINDETLVKDVKGFLNDYRDGMTGAALFRAIPTIKTRLSSQRITVAAVLTKGAKKDRAGNYPKQKLQNELARLFVEYANIEDAALRKQIRDYMADNDLLALFNNGNKASFQQRLTWLEEVLNSDKLAQAEKQEIVESVVRDRDFLEQLNKTLPFMKGEFNRVAATSPIQQKINRVLTNNSYLASAAVMHALVKSKQGWFFGDGRKKAVKAIFNLDGKGQLDTLPEDVKQAIFVVIAKDARLAKHVLDLCKAAKQEDKKKFTGKNLYLDWMLSDAGKAQGSKESFAAYVLRQDVATESAQLGKANADLLRQKLVSSAILKADDAACELLSLIKDGNALGGILTDELAAELKDRVRANPTQFNITDIANWAKFARVDMQQAVVDCFDIHLTAMGYEANDLVAQLAADNTTPALKSVVLRHLISYLDNNELNLTTLMASYTHAKNLQGGMPDGLEEKFQNAIKITLDGSNELAIADLLKWYDEADVALKANFLTAIQKQLKEGNYVPARFIELYQGKLAQDSIVTIDETIKAKILEALKAHLSANLELEGHYTLEQLLQWRKQTKAEAVLSNLTKAFEDTIADHLAKYNSDYTAVALIDYANKYNATTLLSDTIAAKLTDDVAFKTFVAAAEAGTPSADYLLANETLKQRVLALNVFGDADQATIQAVQERLLADANVATLEDLWSKNSSLEQLIIKRLKVIFANDKNAENDFFAAAANAGTQQSIVLADAALADSAITYASTNPTTNLTPLLQAISSSQLNLSSASWKSLLKLNEDAAFLDLSKVPQDELLKVLRDSSDAGIKSLTNTHLAIATQILKNDFGKFALEQTDIDSLDELGVFAEDNFSKVKSSATTKLFKWLDKMIIQSDDAKFRTRFLQPHEHIQEYLRKASTSTAPTVGTDVGRTSSFDMTRALAAAGDQESKENLLQDLNAGGKPASEADLTNLLGF